MAKMWPRTLPPEVTRNPLRSTEVRVYGALAATLDQRFVVFYSRPWLGLTWDGQEKDGECDFVIAHPELGLLALEVKGGRIEYDPQTEQWTSIDRQDLRHRIKNPVQQARSSKYVLLEKLSKLREWDGRYIRARHGVVLPDCRRPSADLGADMPREIFCFAEQFPDEVGTWVRARLAGPGPLAQERPLGHDGIRLLERVLAKPVRLQTPLASYLREDARIQDLLTTEQFQILSMLQDNPRAAVGGAAGTGKTILAMEKAQRCVQEGKRTLFLCYNEPLATHVAKVVEQAGVMMRTFHGMCAWMARTANLAVPKRVPEDKLFQEIYPELMIESAELRPDIRFDAVIVDEGQDFAEHWWIAIDSLLADDQACLYVFFDSNQSVYGRFWPVPRDIQAMPVRLPRNLRNTRAIHAAASNFYSGYPVEAWGPEGDAPEWFVVDAAKLALAVSGQFRRLVRDEKVPPGDIAVLGPDQATVDSLVKDGQLDGCAVCRAGTPVSGSVTVDTIRRFKGLERPVVIIAATGLLTDELAYVAISRARTLLIIVGTAAVIDHLRCLHANETPVGEAEKQSGCDISARQAD